MNGGSKLRDVEQLLHVAVVKSNRTIGPIAVCSTPMDENVTAERSIPRRLKFLVLGLKDFVLCRWGYESLKGPFFSVFTRGVANAKRSAERASGIFGTNKKLPFRCPAIPIPFLVPLRIRT